MTTVRRQGHCSSWFRAACAEELDPRALGRLLARALAAEQPHDLPNADWDHALLELQATIDGVADLGERRVERLVQGWLEDHLPGFIARVPMSERRAFVRGLIEYVQERGIDR